MPHQVYRCIKHGEFIVDYNSSTTGRPPIICQVKRGCGREGMWIPQAVSFHIEGGTGAQRRPR